MVINRKLGREEGHEDFGEDNRLQHSLKERKGRGLGFLLSVVEFTFTCLFFYIVISV